MMLGIYASVGVYWNVSDVYSSAVAFFDASPTVYPVGVTLVISLCPLAFFGIGTFALMNRKSYFIFALLVYGVLCFGGYAVYALIALVVWWFFFERGAQPSPDQGPI
jgi:hypothetical protein